MHYLAKVACLVLLGLVCVRFPQESESPIVPIRLQRVGLLLLFAITRLAKRSWIYILVMTIILILGFCLSTLCRPRSRFRQFSDPATCRRILAATGIDEAGQNTLPGVQSRSAANKRLRVTFGIDNSFTTLEDDYCLEFRKSTQRKLSLDKSDWKAVVTTAQCIVRDQIEGKSSVNLVRLVQLLTLKTSMTVLFDLDPTTCDDQALQTIASEINRLWQESKGDSTAVDDVFWRDEGKLARALAAVIPNHPQGLLLKSVIPRYRSISRLFRRISPKLFHQLLPPVEITSRTNPLNYIVPAYEALWRVVLRCFLEVGFRQFDDRDEWISVLDKFLANPILTTFKESSSSPTTPSGISAECLINEALRLYPPTRRIYRHFEIVSEDSKKPVLERVAADIEECQRNTTVWGLDALDFRPRRWLDIPDETREKGQALPYAAFMPFGARRFLCPASFDLGPRMIAVLVGALAAQVSSAGWLLESMPSPSTTSSVSRKDEPVDDPTPLHSGRHAFWSYELVRKNEKDKNLCPSCFAVYHAKEMIN